MAQSAATATTTAAAAAATAYEPRADDVTRVLALLHNNGVVVQNARRAYEELKQYESNPSFCMTLAYLFRCEAAPQHLLQQSSSSLSSSHECVPWQTTRWLLYRRLAGLTLKNNLDRARHALGEAVVCEAARSALYTLRVPHDATLARVAAQIVVKATALTSFDWWVTRAGLGDLATVLLRELLPAGGLCTLAALYTLQYLMEDLPREVGAASEHVVVAVASLATDAATPLPLCKAAFRMCQQVYEQSALLEWDVATLSPLQQGLVNASGVLAEACATLLERGCRGDVALATQTMRTCVLLLDYFDYFMTSSTTTADGGDANDGSMSNNNNNSSNQQHAVEQRFCRTWMDGAVRLVCSAGDVAALASSPHAHPAVHTQPQPSPHPVRRHATGDATHAMHNGGGSGSALASHNDNNNNSSSSSKASSQELMAAAIELVTSVLEMHDRSAGEGATAFLAPPLEAAAAPLTRALVWASRLADEEVANVLHADDCRCPEEPSGSVDYRLHSSSGSSSSKDIAHDDALDDDAAAMTLRRAALKCVESLSVFAPDAALPVILAYVEAAWRHNNSNNNNNNSNNNNNNNNSDDDDWRAREVAVVLLGTVAVGCAAPLEAALPSLVQQLTSVLRDAREHVCVRSIAAWSLSRWMELTLTVAPALLHDAVAVLIACLQSNSRRLQLTSVSALNEALQLRQRYCATTAAGHDDQQQQQQLYASSCASDAACVDFVAPHRDALLHALYACLPVYTTRNLVLLVELLCQVLLQLLYATHDTAAMHALATRLHSERMRRASVFEQTYMAVYVHNNNDNDNDNNNAATTQRVDKDVFALDRALIALLALLPERGMAVECLTTWCAVLQDMCARHVADDDADVVCNTLLLCAGYVSVTPTALLQPWSASSSCALTTLACQLLMHYSDTTTSSVASSTAAAAYVRSAALTLLRRLVRTLGKRALASDAHVIALLALLTSQLTSADVYDVAYRADVVGLVCQLALDDATMASNDNNNNSNSSNEATSAATAAAVTAAAAGLRSDSYGDSLYYYAQMAFHLCRVLAHTPALLAPSASSSSSLSPHLTSVALLLAHADNSLAKSEATQQLCRAVCATTTTTTTTNAATTATTWLDVHVPALLRLTYSWQQAAASFAGTHEALRSLVHCLAQHSRAHVVQQLQALSPAYRDVVMATYGLQQL